MARFFCAVHAPDATPRAFALVEQLPGDDAPTYAVRDLRRLSGDDPTQTVLDVVASEPQYAAQTTFVLTGGQRAVDALHERGPSGVAVNLLDGGSADADALDVPLQVLVDTFEWLYRTDAVDVPGRFDAASDAVDALYTSADLDAAAPDSDRDPDGDLTDDDESETLAGTEVEGDGPKPAVIEQSGGEADVSTEVIRTPITMDDASAAAVDAERRVGRVAASTNGPAPDLGDHADVAIALALACWYGETSRDELPATDKLDEALAARNPDDNAANRGQQEPAGRS
ncbi:hypothetical protein RQM47_07285 [Rubrivirga sp. S365]|uniref:Uncharacterized protein n=1 Tax=Rubrivirga litoralis TaxID=3075598 RepID=A0ABU3BNC0_9BACT|nr:MULTISPECIES: hypothetical protein [unclassified Rubrivirga]MDT0630768.1 hypothetical protein [Rubrivirga sp. F394]MDT7856438.1 hypothetical protein [Rubrivirga sp. S365]